MLQRMYVPPSALHGTAPAPGMRRHIVVESHMAAGWIGVGILLAIGTAAIALGSQARSTKEPRARIVR